MSAHRWVPGIDMVKPVLALLVIWIHTQPLAGITPRVSAYATIGVARLAVPLYLAISGYLLFRRADAPVRRQLRRVLELYAVWLVIYLPVIIRDELEEGLQGPLHLVQLLLTGGRTHLWYLPAAAVGIVIVAAGLKVFSPGRLLVVLSCLSAVGTLAYGALDRELLPHGAAAVLSDLEYLSLAPRDGVFTGACFIAAGAWVGRTGGWRPRTAAWVAGSAWIVLFVEAVARRSLLFGAHPARPVSTSWLAALVLVPALLCLLVAVTTAKPLPGQLLARNTGSLVYFIHYWVMLALGADLVHSAGLVRGVLITLVSFALGAALVQASQLRGLGVLKRLY